MSRQSTNAGPWANRLEGMDPCHCSTISAISDDLEVRAQELGLAGSKRLGDQALKHPKISIAVPFPMGEDVAWS